MQRGGSLQTYNVETIEEAGRCVLFCLWYRYVRVWIVYQNGREKNSHEGVAWRCRKRQQKLKAEGGHHQHPLTSLAHPRPPKVTSYRYSYLQPAGCMVPQAPTKPPCFDVDTAAPCRWPGAPLFSASFQPCSVFVAHTHEQAHANQTCQRD